MIARRLTCVRRRAPLIHNITNYVTANDVANVLLSCGASPIMSDEPADIAEITARCDGLHINLGTLRQDRLEGMFIAGRTANEKGSPVVLDPVGIGASSLRRQTAARLLHDLHITAVRCNASELRALMSGVGSARGVDADSADRVNDQSLRSMAALTREAANTLGCIVALSGEIDLVTDGTRCFAIRNGRPEMRRVTGTGCQLSALVTAFLAANPDDALEAAAAACCTMGLAGELALARLQPGEGNATYRCRIIDAIDGMTEEMLSGGARCDLIDMH